MKRHREHIDHFAAAASAQAIPGAWVWAGNYPSSVSAKSAAASVRAARFPGYRPAGAFEAYAAPLPEEEALWVRYVADGAVHPALPDRMTVRVTDRGTGRGYEGVRIVTVTIRTTCAECGAPRGWNTVKPNRFCEDGAYYTADTWTNPCGHADMYAAVLRESRLRPLPPVTPVSAEEHPAIDPKTASDPVRVILDAAAGQKWMHGQQAVQLLAERGHAGSAAALQEELSARGGHMSARQAAEFLHALSQPAPAIDLTETPEGVQ